MIVLQITSAAALCVGSLIALFSSESGPDVILALIAILS